MDDFVVFDTVADHPDSLAHSFQDLSLPPSQGQGLAQGKAPSVSKEGLRVPLFQAEGGSLLRVCPGWECQGHKDSVDGPEPGMAGRGSRVSGERWELSVTLGGPTGPD